MMKCKIPKCTMMKCRIAECTRMKCRIAERRAVLQYQKISLQKDFIKMGKGEDNMKQLPVGREVRILSNLIHRKINQMVAEEEETLTAHQDWVLSFLVRNEEQDVVQRDIEKEFSIRRSTASHMLSLMENNGYIERMEVPHDARMKRIVITEKGREAQKRMQERLARFERMLQADVSDEEIAEFLRIAEKLAKNIE